eukprot:gb/GECG01008082.1/.p1 GENE.gb/GECG01008082.1/~~gb/GECG01008082.1/.p1  ORF type:complete len:101 (+),score=5.36 gb/GECG01008082.1/:1-303(+)
MSLSGQQSQLTNSPRQYFGCYFLLGHLSENQSLIHCTSLATATASGASTVSLHHQRHQEGKHAQVVPRLIAPIVTLRSLQRYKNCETSEKNVMHPTVALS